MSKKLRIGQKNRPGNRPFIAISIQAKNKQELSTCVRIANESHADVIEWRIDAWQDLKTLTPTVIVATIAEIQQPMILTWRTAEEGGQKAYDRNAYYRLYKTAITSGVGAIDLEVRWIKELAELRALANQYDVPVIASRHDWEWPIDMTERLMSLKDLPVDIIKYAVTVEYEEHVTQLLMTTQTLSEMTEKPLITMGMGSYGSATRLDGFTYGSQLTFAHLGVTSAPGQLTLHEVRNHFEVD